jgi:hypothetical protein
MKIGRRAILAIAASVAGAHTASAQVVTGSVVLPDSVTPLMTRVLVEARDPKGVTLARALTTSRGTFTLNLPAAGAVDIRVLRIGNRPSIGPRLSVAAGETRSVRIVYRAEPISLATITVRERETCRVQSDSGLMVARLWEEARKAMLASQLSADDVPLEAEWIEYNRAFDSTSRIVRRQTVRTSKSPTTHAFRSVPAGVLQESGYVVTESDATNYYAPDAEVLLSEAFVDSHCFHLVAPAHDEDQGRIGIAFVPTRERANMKEIDGTLWLDRATAELRTLTFRFLNLPEAANGAKPGGTVDFLRLNEGSWLVKRWSIRMPELANTFTLGTSNLANARFANRVVLRAVRVTGGEVIRVTHRDALIYKATGEAISVQVIAHDTLMSARGARLDLEGTDYTALADARGLISLSPVLAGQYRARVRTALMDSLHMPPIALNVETHAEMRVDSIALPSARDVLANACPADAIAGNEGMIHGWVKDSRAEPVPHATVVATWQENFATLGTATGDVISVRTKTAGGITDSGGYWRICGMPQATLLTVSITSAAGSDVQKVRLESHPFAQVNLVMHQGGTGRP